MLRFRFHLIALLIFAGFALNIERLDVGSAEDIVNLASFVYVLLGIVTISTIMLPGKWKIHTRTVVIAWVFIYLVIKALMRESRPLIGGIYTYLTIVELLILVIVILLTRRFMESVYQLEETIASITLADVSDRVKSIDAALPDINKEFARSRRYNRPLGLVVVRLDPNNVRVNINNISQDILRTMISRYSMSNLIRAIDKDIRRPDLILEQHKENRIIILLPEANIEAAQSVSENIRRIAKAKLESDLAIGAAAFPDDAITFEDLVSFAESKIYDYKLEPLVEQETSKQDLSQHNEVASK